MFTLGTDCLRWKLALFDIILLSIALGIDCLVVSFSQGLIFTENRTVNSLKLACVMGLFQGLMPLVGYIGADKLYKYVLPFSHWIVFGIFLTLGLKFIFESFTSEKPPVKCLDIKCLVSLGIATSIDALVSGASLRLTHTNLLLACIIIGVGSFLMSVTGFWSGNKLKSICSTCLEKAGGIILIALAIKSII